MKTLLQTFIADQELITYVVLPLVIFAARVLDVSIATVKLMFVVNDNRKLAFILGFIEAFIMIIALGEIIQNADNIISYIFFALGFATGTFSGMWIENKLAHGKLFIRLMTKVQDEEFYEYLRENNFRFNHISAADNDGNTDLVFILCSRKREQEIKMLIDYHFPNALYTVEAVKKVNKEDLFVDERKKQRRPKMAMSLRLF